jgi:hypothetical protein
MGAPPHVESWGGARYDGRAVRAQGRQVRPGGGADTPLERVPARTGESGADGWAPL